MCKCVSVLVCVRVCFAFSVAEPFLPARKLRRASSSETRALRWPKERIGGRLFALRVPFETLALGRGLEMVHRKVRVGNGLLHDAALQNARS